jgi:hypothetical protein
MDAAKLKELQDQMVLMSKVPLEETLLMVMKEKMTISSFKLGNKSLLLKGVEDNFISNDLFGFSNRREL